LTLGSAFQRGIVANLIDLARHNPRPNKAEESMMPKDETPAGEAVDDRIPPKDRWALILIGVAIG
jgi:hypothetical protein